MLNKRSKLINSDLKRSNNRKMPLYQRNIEQKYYNITEEQLKNGTINAYSLLPKGEIPKMRRVSAPKDGVKDQSKIVSIDSEQIWPVLARLPRYSNTIYFYLVNLLEDNRRAVVIHQTELRNKSTDIAQRRSFELQLDILIASGLIFRFRSHEFYINPLYAWVGDRSQYFDADRLPFLAE